MGARALSIDRSTRSQVVFHLRGKCFATRFRMQSGFRVLTPISTPSTLGSPNSRERESIVETNICSCHPIFSQSQQTRLLGSVSVRADPFRRDSRTNLSRELYYLPSTSSLLSFVFVSSSFFLPNVFLPLASPPKPHHA